MLSQPVAVPVPAIEVSWPAVVQAVAAAVAVVVSVVGFIVVWLQLQGLKKASQSEANGKIYTASAEILKLFVARPHLRQYFFDNAKLDKGDPDAGRVDTIVEMFLCHLEHVLLQLDNLPELDRQSWVDWARWLHKSSPAIREGYAEFRKLNIYVTAMDEFMYGKGEMPKMSALRRRLSSAQVDADPTDDGVSPTGTSQIVRPDGCDEPKPTASEQV